MLKHSTKNCAENLIVIKPKRNFFLENWRHYFLDIRKNFTKTKVQTSLIWLRINVATKSLECIAKFDTILEQFAWLIFNSFLWKKRSDDIWSINFEQLIIFFSCGLYHVSNETISKHKRRASNTLTLKPPTPQNRQTLKQFVGCYRRIVWV